MPSALAAAEAATTPSAARSVWASPLYRGATVALFLSGLGTSAAAPQITLFLVNDLHVSLTTAGLFYLTNITAPLAGYLIGARSDRSGKRLGLFRWCALAGFLGWVAMALADQVWMPFVISAVVLAFSGAAGSQLFAAVHDDLQTTASPVADGVVSIVRMALTAGWVVGPVLGSILATAAGSRVMLAATGLCALAQIVPMGLARTGSARPGVHAASAAKCGPSVPCSARSSGRCCRCSRSPGCTCSSTRVSRSSTATCRSTCATTCICRRRSAARSSASSLW